MCKVVFINKKFGQVSEVGCTRQVSHSLILNVIFTQIQFEQIPECIYLYIETTLTPESIVSDS
jgi:hypothetical protein